MGSIPNVASRSCSDHDPCGGGNGAARHLEDKSAVTELTRPGQFDRSEAAASHHTKKPPP